MDKAKYYKLNKANLIMTSISILIAVLAILCITLIQKDYSFFRLGMCGVYVLLTILPYVLGRVFKWIIPLYISIPYYIFILLSTMIGTIFGLYNLFGAYDIILHGLSGVLLGGFGLYIYRVANTRNESRLVVAIFMILGIAVLGGVIWEIWEYLTDEIIGLNSQRYNALDGTAYVGHSALRDTMYDLMSDLLGGILFVVGYCIYYYKKPPKAVRSVRKK